MKYALQAIALYMLMATISAAQTFPDHASTTINDFADLLPASTEETLHSRLTTLRRDTGIEMTIVTLPSQTGYAPDMTMERFATALFDHWGVGNAQRNDGIMVLVLPQDRAMRIELGAGFGREWDNHAARIVERDVLPQFRNGQYALGIINGADAVIDEIAIPFSEGATRTPSNGADRILIGFFAVIALVVAGFRHILDYVTRLRTCPQCGARGTLRVQRRTILRATRTLPGQKEKTVTCTRCDYRNVTHWATAQLRSNTSSGSGGSFGGGRSGGGGASGRW